MFGAWPGPWQETMTSEFHSKSSNLFHLDIWTFVLLRDSNKKLEAVISHRYKLTGTLSTFSALIICLISKCRPVLA